MDPTANLKEQLERALDVTADPAIPLGHPARRLAELVIALNGWMLSGGFLPTQWTKQ